MIVFNQILTAVHNALTGDASLTAVVPAAQIGNHLPDGTDASDYPHILYGFDAEDAQIKGMTAYTIQLTIDVWSNYRGEKQAWDINDLVVAVLDRSPVTIASGTITYQKLSSVSIDTEDDGRTRHGTIIYNLMATE